MGAAGAGAGAAACGAGAGAGAGGAFGAVLQAARKDRVRVMVRGVMRTGILVVGRRALDADRKGFGRTVEEFWERRLRWRLSG
jgi:hypothetical protein